MKVSVSISKLTRYHGPALFRPSAIGFSFRPMSRHQIRRRSRSPEEVAYLKRVAKNKAKARAKQKRAERLAEEHRILKLNRELYQRENELTDEDMVWEAQQIAMCRRSSQKQRAAKLKATPKWADFEKIKAIYEEAARLETFTGIPMHVDHVVPLGSRIVCGLNWEQNLQILTKSENIAKRNRWWPEMP